MALRDYRPQIPELRHQSRKIATKHKEKKSRLLQGSIFLALILLASVDVEATVDPHWTGIRCEQRPSYDYVDAANYGQLPNTFHVDHCEITGAAWLDDDYGEWVQPFECYDSFGEILELDCDEAGDLYVMLEDGFPEVVIQDHYFPSY